MLAQRRSSTLNTLVVLFLFVSTTFPHFSPAYAQNTHSIRNGTFEDPSLIDRFFSLFKTADVASHWNRKGEAAFTIETKDGRTVQTVQNAQKGSGIDQSVKIIADKPFVLSATVKVEKGEVGVRFDKRVLPVKETTWQTITILSVARDHGPQATIAFTATADGSSFSIDDVNVYELDMNSGKPLSGDTAIENPGRSSSSKIASPAQDDIVYQHVSYTAAIALQVVANHCDGSTPERTVDSATNRCPYVERLARVDFDEMVRRFEGTGKTFTFSGFGPSWDQTVEQGDCDFYSGGQSHPRGFCENANNPLSLYAGIIHAGNTKESGGETFPEWGSLGYVAPARYQAEGTTSVIDYWEDGQRDRNTNGKTIGVFTHEVGHDFGQRHAFGVSHDSIPFAVGFEPYFYNDLSTLATTDEHRSKREWAYEITRRTPFKSRDPVYEWFIPTTSSVQFRKPNGQFFTSGTIEIYTPADPRRYGVIKEFALRSTISQTSQYIPIDPALWEYGNLIYVFREGGDRYIGWISVMDANMAYFRGQRENVLLTKDTNKIVYTITGAVDVQHRIEGDSVKVLLERVNADNTYSPADEEEIKNFSQGDTVQYTFNRFDTSRYAISVEGKRPSNAGFVAYGDPVGCTGTIVDNGTIKRCILNAPGTANFTVVMPIIVSPTPTAPPLTYTSSCEIINFDEVVVGSPNNNSTYRFINTGTGPWNVRSEHTSEWVDVRAQVVDNETGENVTPYFLGTNDSSFIRDLPFTVAGCPVGRTCLTAEIPLKLTAQPQHTDRNYRITINVYRVIQGQPSPSSIGPGCQRQFTVRAASPRADLDSVCTANGLYDLPDPLIVGRNYPVRFSYQNTGQLGWGGHYGPSVRLGVSVSNAYTPDALPVESIQASDTYHANLTLQLLPTVRSRTRIGYTLYRPFNDGRREYFGSECFREFDVIPLPTATPTLSPTPTITPTLPPLAPMDGTFSCINSSTMSIAWNESSPVVRYDMTVYRLIDPSVQINPSTMLPYNPNEYTDVVTHVRRPEEVCSSSGGNRICHMDIPIQQGKMYIIRAVKTTALQQSTFTFRQIPSINRSLAGSVKLSCDVPVDQCPYTTYGEINDTNGDRIYLNTRLDRTYLNNTRMSSIPIDHGRATLVEHLSEQDQLEMRLASLADIDRSKYSVRAHCTGSAGCQTTNSEDTLLFFPMCEANHTMKWTLSCRQPLKMSFTIEQAQGSTVTRAQFAALRFSLERVREGQITSIGNWPLGTIEEINGLLRNASQWNPSSFPLQINGVNLTIGDTLRARVITPSALEVVGESTIDTTLDCGGYDNLTWAIRPTTPKTWRVRPQAVCPVAGGGVRVVPTDYWTIPFYRVGVGPYVEAEDSVIPVTSTNNNEDMQFGLLWFNTDWSDVSSLLPGSLPSGYQIQQGSIPVTRPGGSAVERDIHRVRWDRNQPAGNVTLQFQAPQAWCAENANQKNDGVLDTAQKASRPQVGMEDTYPHITGSVAVKSSGLIETASFQSGDTVTIALPTIIDEKAIESMSIYLRKLDAPTVVNTSEASQGWMRVQTMNCRISDECERAITFSLPQGLSAGNYELSLLIVDNNDPDVGKHIGVVSPSFIAGTPFADSTKPCTEATQASTYCTAEGLATTISIDGTKY